MSNGFFGRLDWKVMQLLEGFYKMLLVECACPSTCQRACCTLRWWIQCL